MKELKINIDTDSIEGLVIPSKTFNEFIRLETSEFLLNVLFEHFNPQLPEPEETSHSEYRSRMDAFKEIIRCLRALVSRSSTDVVQCAFEKKYIIEAHIPLKDEGYLFGIAILENEYVNKLI